MAFVTGAGAGIGLATAKAFAEAGASVVLADVSEAQLFHETQNLLAAGAAGYGHRLRCGGRSPSCLNG
ncbi:SDR family NAD(P)-dependent oxidoreductase [Pseudomonas fluorescens]|uniref:SDR family NAD(P)-dependent oxidoreductase n=1 Tax=Pseudomonas fluorescens TaxID=294 RepID=UPI0027D79425|nr:SDR family NAD(P)-dependent oxidoreductase [Pseudomonas fluorescens]